MSIKVSGFSSCLVVKSFKLALVITIFSLFRLVSNSLVGVLKGTFGKTDLFLDASEFRLSVSEGTLGNIEGDSNEVTGLLISLDSLVFSESLKVEGILDLLE